MKYVAFLRGINVGGNHKVPMGDLKKVLEEHGLSDVKTLLNSGNVVFESEGKSVVSLKNQIEQLLDKIFGFSIPVMLRTYKAIQDMVNSGPFKEITVTPETRLYVTFLSEIPQITREVPYSSPDKHFRILQITDDAVFSVIILSKGIDTTKMMSQWEKEFGKNVTTRNWNTLIKLAKV